MGLLDQLSEASLAEDFVQLRLLAKRVEKSRGNAFAAALALAEAEFLELVQRKKNVDLWVYSIF